jgi:spiro-SPASM protein
VSLDAAAEGRYAEVRGAGFSEAVSTAKTLLGLFPNDAYVQAVRVAGAEDDIEQFYRSWKETAGAERIIIQKYDDFAGALPKKQAADLSPVERRPCWHLLRDMSVFMDGTVSQCREDLSPIKSEVPLEGGAGTTLKNVVAHGALGNAFQEPLETLWDRGLELYRAHCSRRYPGICTESDEYYTFNF